MKQHNQYGPDKMLIGIFTAIAAATLLIYFAN